MDLSSLPDEMLTIVLKYTKYGRIMKLRKMNEKIDVLAKRNNFCERVPVDKFDYQDPLEWGLFSVRLYLNKDDEADLEVESPLTFATTYDIADTAGKFLPRIKVGKEFIMGAGQGIDLMEKDIEMLHKQRRALQKVEKLSIFHAIVDICEASAKKIYQEIFPNISSLEMIVMVYVNIFNEKLLSGRKWKRIDFDSVDDINYINDAFFREVATNCEEIVLKHVSERFTIEGIVDLFKSCIAKDGLFNRKFDLGLILSQTSSIADIQNIFNSIDFPGIKIMFGELVGDHGRYEKCRLCKITFDDHLDAPFLQFWLHETHPIK